jgi:iron complex transport system permease protein
MAPTGRLRAYAIYLALFVVLLALAIASLGIGRYIVAPATVVRILAAMAARLSTATAAGAWTDAQWAIVEFVRLPRVMLSILCGAGLALSGAALQGLFRNPLVGPEVAGVSHGAAFGGVVAIVLAFGQAGIVGCAFAGGLSALVLTFLLSRIGGTHSILSMVLAGIIVGAFFSATVGVAQYLADPETQLPTIVYWLLGSFANADMTKVRTVAAPLALAGGALMLLRWRLNLLSLGEADAQVLGVNVTALRWSVAALVAVIVAAQVSVSGGVNWIGLVIPHFARMLVGANHRTLLPTSALLGGIYLLAMDDIARTAIAQEIPIGLLTALFGTPVFAIVFWKLQNKGWAHE